MTRIATPECGVNVATTDNFDVRNYLSHVAWWAAGSAARRLAAEQMTGAAASVCDSGRARGLVRAWRFRRAMRVTYAAPIPTIDNH
jgi:hypothetical protein